MIVNDRVNLRYKNKGIGIKVNYVIMEYDISLDSLLELATCKLIFQQLIGCNDPHWDDIEHSFSSPYFVVEFLDINHPNDSPKEDNYE